MHHRRESNLAVDYSKLRQAGMAIPRNDQVVAHRNPNDLSSLHKLPGNGQVLLAWLWVPAGMVVDDNQGCSRALDGDAEDLTRMDKTGIERPSANGGFTDDPIAGVEAKQVKLFLKEVSEMRSHQQCDIIRTSHHGAVPQR